MGKGQPEVTSKHTHWYVFSSAPFTGGAKDGTRTRLFDVPLYFFFFFFFLVFIGRWFVRLKYSRTHKHACVHTNHLDLHIYFFLFSPHARALSCKKVLLLSLLDIKIEIVDYFFSCASNNLVYTTPDLYVTFTFSNLFNLSPQVRKSFSTTTFNFKLGIQCAIFVHFCINVTNAFLCKSKPSMSVFFLFCFYVFFCKHGCPHSTPNCSRRTGKINCISGVRKPPG